MVILTDFVNFPRTWKATEGSKNEALILPTGATFRDLFQQRPAIRQADVVVLHEGALQLFYWILFFFLFPGLRKPIVSVDLILRKPHTFTQRVLAALKKILLRRVDHFIHYFKDLRGYDRYYGISAARSAYVPFKSNVLGIPHHATLAASEKEEYLFTVGLSLRDLKTFFDAVAHLPYPAAITRYTLEHSGQHGSRAARSREELPKNLTILDDDGSQESLIRNFGRARIVVIPILRDSLCASGIGSYLDAMVLKKCVIISDGPGVSDVLTGQVIPVPPEDPEALAQAIRSVWEDDARRQAVALRGYQYAEPLGTEPDLMNRILEEIQRWYGRV